MRVCRTLVSITIAAALGSSTAAAQRATCDAAPGIATVFAPHLADSAKLFRGQLTSDGQELWFFKKVTSGEEEDYRIFVSRLHGGRWGPAERIPINGEFSELYPAISPDGRRLVFSSYQPVPGDTTSYKNAHIYVAERQNQGWGRGTLQRTASILGHYNSGPVVGPRGELWFSVTTPDWRTQTTMVSDWNGREYGPARRREIPGVTQWKNWREDLYLWGGQLAPGDSVAILDVSPIGSDGRRGPSDVYLSIRTGDRWSVPRPAGAGMNSADYDNFVFFSPDGCELLFTRGFSSFYHVSLAAVLAGP